MIVLETVAAQKNHKLILNNRKAGLVTGVLDITKKENAEYHELLKTLGLGLEDRMTSKVGLLSGGQRQAVTLLMATLKKPKLPVSYTHLKGSRYHGCLVRLWLYLERSLPRTSRTDLAR